jgi:anti-sigma B factor antagonist
MSEGTWPAQRISVLAVVTLPENIDQSNAGQVREQLLLVINRGAAVLIADMTATVSCDLSGADALARAGQHADASGTQLRLAVTAQFVRRVLSHSGLDPLVPIYPTVEAALAAEAGRRDSPGEAGTVAISPPVPEPPGAAQAPPADRVARAEELLDSVVNSIFQVAVSLQTAPDLPRDLSAERITEALQHLDDVVREIRHHVFADRRGPIPADLAEILPSDLPERLALARARAATLRQRVAQTAYTLHFAAADTTALLERRAGLLRPPGRVDFPTEVKRWRAIAEQARLIAEHWEQWS